MIADSLHWRRELLAASATLRAAEGQEGISEDEFIELESALLLGAFRCRRLADSFKIPAETMSKRISCCRLPRHDFQDRYWHEGPLLTEYAIDLYDFQDGQVVQLELGFICNQLIHSRHLLVEWSDSGDAALFLASDRNRRDQIYVFWLADLATLFAYAASVDPGCVSRSYDEARQRTQTAATGERRADRLVYWGLFTAERLSEAFLGPSSMADRTAEIASFTSQIHSEIRRSQQD